MARREKLVLEEYFYGFNRDTYRDLRYRLERPSYRVNLERGDAGNGTQIAPQSKEYDVLAEMGPFANPDPRKSEITLPHLMTQSAVLRCYDYSATARARRISLKRIPGDSWKPPLDYRCGADRTPYAYWSANFNLVGAALTVSIRIELPERFERTVTGLLQFRRWHWNHAPTDERYLGGGMWLRPRDLLKIGQTYLNGGVVKRRRMVLAAWIAVSTTPPMHISPAIPGTSHADFAKQLAKAQGGYAWHHRPNAGRAASSGRY